MTTKNSADALGLPANSTDSNEAPKGSRQPILPGWVCERNVTVT